MFHSRRSSENFLHAEKLGSGNSAYGPGRFSSRQRSDELRDIWRSLRPLPERDLSGVTLHSKGFYNR